MKNTINIEGVNYAKSAIKCVYIWQDNVKYLHDDPEPDLMWRVAVQTLDGETDNYNMSGKNSADDVLNDILLELDK